jgi:hypothetical protein
MALGWYFGKFMGDSVQHPASLLPLEKIITLQGRLLGYLLKVSLVLFSKQR